MKNHLYGARFKSWTGGNGLAANITWRNIVLQHVKFPVRFISARLADYTGLTLPTVDLRHPKLLGSRGEFYLLYWSGVSIPETMSPLQKGPKPNTTSTTSTHLENILFDNFSGDIDE